MNFSIRPDLNTRVDYQTRQASLVNKPAEQTESIQKVDKDTVSISKGKAIDDRSFVNASDKRVAELHQQVQSGTYRPNAQRIAEKILGYKD